MRRRFGSTIEFQWDDEAGEIVVDTDARGIFQVSVTARPDGKFALRLIEVPDSYELEI
ncbi:hypothetical protein [Streptomyces sp. NPDC003697]